MASALWPSQTIPRGQGGGGAPTCLLDEIRGAPALGILKARGDGAPALGIAGTRGQVLLRTCCQERQGPDHSPASTIASAEHYGGHVLALQEATRTGHHPVWSLLPQTRTPRERRVPPPLTHAHSSAPITVSSHPGLSPDAPGHSGMWQGVGPWVEDPGPPTPPGAGLWREGTLGSQWGRGQAHPGGFRAKKALIRGQPATDSETQTHRTPQEGCTKPLSSANSQKQTHWTER